MCKKLLSKSFKIYSLNNEGNLYLQEYAKYKGNGQPFCHYTYDEKGYLIKGQFLDYSEKNTERRIFQEKDYQKVETRKYNKKGQLIEETFYEITLFHKYIESRVSIEIIYNSSNKINRKIINFEKEGKFIKQEEIIYQYDERGNCTYYDEPIYSKLGEPFLPKFISAVYDDINRLIKCKAKESTIDFLYNKNGILTKTIETSNDSGKEIGETLYDNQGNKILEENSLEKIEYIYDKSGKVIEELMTNTFGKTYIKYHYQDNNIHKKISYNEEDKITEIEEWEYFYEEDSQSISNFLNETYGLPF